MAKGAFNKKKDHSTSKFDLNLLRNLVKCYIWSVVLYGAEIWTLRKVNHKYLESFKMQCWRRTQKIILTDCVRNQEVLHTTDHIWRRNCLLKHLIEERIEGRLEATGR
jgi:hypothetical protein